LAAGFSKIGLFENSTPMFRACRQTKLADNNSDAYSRNLPG